ncbi:MAG: hypothetical protein WCK70_20290 [Chloroflexales bacterium]|jgi:hypothetical protein
MTTHRRPRSLHTFRFEVEVGGVVIGSVGWNREDGYRAETQNAQVLGWFDRKREAEMELIEATRPRRRAA